MSLQVDAIARHAAIVADLARQMTELAELRRAVCLQMALRSRPRGARRAIRRVSARRSFSGALADSLSLVGPTHTRP
jgi:hypothetical protein